MTFSSLPKPFRGIVPPMATPLLDSDILDVAGVERLVEHILAGGVHGLFILGTTGEAPSLSPSLQRELITRVCTGVAGRVPVLVGITHPARAEALRMGRFAAEAGADGVVLAPPYYFPLEQDDLARYVENLCCELPLPLFLYNMPSHTKIDFAPDTIRRLVQQEGIVGFKDSSARAGCFNQIRTWIGKVRPDFSLFIGPEELVAESIPLGAHGGVCGGANVFPRLFVDLYHAAVCGEAATVAALQQCVQQLADTVYAIGERSGGTIVRIKAALACLGVCTARVAQPLHELTTEESELLGHHLSRLSEVVESRRDARDCAVPPTH